MTRDPWDDLVKKYGISGYTDSLIFVKYETFKELVEKAEMFDKMPQMIRNIELKKRLEAIKNYCENTLKVTEDFPNWTSQIRNEMENILDILEGSQRSGEKPT